MLGAFRWPARPPMPIETGLPSVKARAGAWQVAQATVPSPENRPSKTLAYSHFVTGEAALVLLGPHNSEEPSHASDYDNRSGYREVGLSGSWH